MRSFLAFRRLGVALLVPVLTGCHSWRPTEVAPHAVIAEERPQTVRLTLADGSVMTISNPMIVADSIVGSAESGTGGAAADDVRTLEVERLSVPRTLGLVVVHVSTVVSLIALIIAVQPHYSGF